MARTDNPAAAGIMMGLGAFFQSFAQARFAQQQFEFEEEKFNEVQRQNISSQQRVLEEEKLNERAQIVREFNAQTQRLLPAIRIQAEIDLADDSINADVRRSQALKQVDDEFAQFVELRENQEFRDRQRFQHVTIDQERVDAGLAPRGSPRSPAGSEIDPNTSLPRDISNRALTAANNAVNTAQRNEGRGGPLAGLALLMGEAPDVSGLPKNFQDIWANAYLTALQAFDYDRVRVGGFLVRSGVNPEILRRHGIIPPPEAGAQERKTFEEDEKSISEDAMRRLQELHPERFEKDDKKKNGPQSRSTPKTQSRFDKLFGGPEA